ncbi:15205_t:CDS:2 [Entrophospora sp. SA101]|nr:15205_t:CDS:2 [Entrophospora sp. SA101]
MGNPNYNGSPPPSNDLSIVQEKQISSYTSYERSETQTDNVSSIRIQPIGF